MLREFTKNQNKTKWTTHFETLFISIPFCNILLPKPVYFHSIYA